MWGVRVGYMLMCKLKVEGKKVNPSSHLFPLTIIQMKSDTSPPTPPTAPPIMSVEPLSLTGAGVGAAGGSDVITRRHHHQFDRYKASPAIVECVEAVETIC